MIDLHCHILPGIDDGARSLDQAVAMCRAAAAAGCEALVATPHQRRGPWWNCDRREIERLGAELQAAVGPAPRIYLGGEVHVDPWLLEDLRHIAENGGSAAPTGPLSLAGSHHLLIEFGEEPSLAGAADLIHELSVAGWRPVIAHPEQFPWLAENPAALAHLVSLGAFAQVTAMSITGERGRRVQANTCRLIDLGLVHFVASDCHDLVRRPPGMEAAWKAVAARWGEAAADELTIGNPRIVVADREELPHHAAPAAGDTARAGAPADSADAANAGDAGEAADTVDTAGIAGDEFAPAELAAGASRQGWRSTR